MKRSQVLIILLLFFIVLIGYFHKYLSGGYNTLALFIVNMISFITGITIMFGHKKIESKIAWTMFVLFVPVVGFLFYVILGIEYNRFTKFDKKISFVPDIEQEMKKDKDKVTEMLRRLGSKRDIMTMVYHMSKSPVCLDTKTEILTNGDEKFERLLKELKKATSFIHLEYFILKEGKVFDSIKEILIEKAQKGVEVRILYDDFGSVDLSKELLLELHRYGIKTACFNKIDFKLLRPSVNYRNHRKIVVIDNKVAFTGGINIGDEYVHMDPYYGFWRDTHIVLEGRAVNQLHLVFIKDWYHTTNELLLNEKYLMEYRVSNQESAVQVVSDGPDNTLELIHSTFFKMINEANERVWIVTPYLVLDTQLVTALKIAALSGIDVRIIVPGRHDKGKYIIYKATESYFSELLEAGVKIYCYNNQFIHSKVLIIDDDIASVGTVNFDYRSFDLHFEDTVLLYFDPSIQKLIQDYEEDLKVSTLVTWEEWKKRNIFQKSIESLVKIFSPLL